MLIYNNKAKFIKNIDHTNYRLWASISNSLMKKRSDSSALIRLYSCMLDEVSSLGYDLIFLQSFENQVLWKNKLSRFKKYILSSLNSTTVDYQSNKYTVSVDMVGYSKYTAGKYTLKWIEDKSDFINFSLPVDCFIEKYKTPLTADLITLEPYVPKILDKKIDSSVVTFMIYGALTQESLDTFNSYLTLEIKGIDILNNEVTEYLSIVTDLDLTTANKYLYLSQISLLGASTSLDILVYPFITKHSIIWENTLVDRKELDENLCVVKLDAPNKNLTFSIIRQNNLEYPWYQDITKKVALNGLDGKEIVDYYFDEDKRLLYIITLDSMLFAYHVVIPKKYTGVLDTLKEGKQLLNIEYYENSIEETYDFFLFPNTETAEVDIVDVYVDDVKFTGNIFIDMIRNNMDTNKITIPFSTLFANSDSAIVKFVSFGDETSVMPIFVDNPGLEVLYSKNLLTVQPAIQPLRKAILSADSSSSIDYSVLATNGITIDANSQIYKTKRNEEIRIDGYSTKEVYNTFFYDDNGNIITHDTITDVINPHLGPPPEILSIDFVGPTNNPVITVQFNQSMDPETISNSNLIFKTAGAI